MNFLIGLMAAIGFAATVIGSIVALIHVGASVYVSLYEKPWENVQTYADSLSESMCRRLATANNRIDELEKRLEAEQKESRRLSELVTKILEREITKEVTGEKA